MKICISLKNNFLISGNGIPVVLAEDVIAWREPAELHLEKG